MSKKSTKALASAALMSLVLTTALSAGPVKAAQGKITRTSGATRYATASQVATTNWTSGSENVVLVSGEGYADAVSASALAKKLNAPILLTTPDTLSTDAQTALTTLKPKNIYVIGGTASISQSIRDGLKANYTLTELGGATRYETNAAVADELVKLGVDASNVMVVGGQGFSDALSVAPVAAAKGQILLLANNDQTATKPVIDFINANKSKVTVVGTSNVINDTIYNALGATTRVDGGNSRFDTNLKVLAAFKDSLKTDKLYIANASAADPDNLYADALVASAVAGKYSAPLVLVDKDGTDATNSAVAYIKDNTTKSTDLQLVGGTAVVSQATEDAINKIYNPDGPVTGDNTVAEVNPVNLNQFEVVFNSNIDEDTAELTKNYKVAGTDLNDDNAHVEKINDNTVRVTLVRSKFNNINQGDEKTVTIKKGILTEDKTQTIEKADKKVTFKDIEAPTIKDVSIKGNNKLVIEFSEAVNMKDLDEVANLVEINDSNLPSYDTAEGLSEIEEGTKVDSEGNVWANKVQFYFTSKLKSGENTIKVKDGKNGVLVDAAGFNFKETEETVTVDDVSTKPEVQSIKATDNGKVYIKFDRAMDSKTVKNNNNYSINDKPLPDSAVAELDDDDKTDSTIKISHLGDILKDDSNIIEFQDGLKDAYGNKIEDETRKSFDKEKDETKPTVLSASVIDNTTLRVQFSEDVKYNYATNKDNYELKDSSDVDVMHTDKDKIDIVASNGKSDDTDTYDIKFDNTSTKLDSSKYTLTVKNVVDLANEPNKMDDQTVDVDGDTSESPSLNDIEAFQKKDSTTEVAIYFGKEMDSSSLRDSSNYFYVDGDGDQEELPEDVDIKVSSDNKSVVLDFDDANKTINPTGTGDDVVTKIGVKTAKDANGNEVYVGALTIDSSSATGPKLKDDTLKLSKDGDDVTATFQLDTPLDKKDASDFEIISAKDSNVTPIVADSIDTNSKEVKLTFDEGVKADAVMALGTDAEIKVIGQKSVDIAGRSIQLKDKDGNDISTQQVYYYGIAPETDRDNYTADITTAEDGTKTVKVNVKLKTPVDTSLYEAYKDDFDFTYDGRDLDVKGVELQGTTLVFTLDPADTDVQKVEAKGTIGVSAADTGDIDLRTAKDGDGKSVKWVPTTDDTKIKYITVEDAK
ncbi:cell wall-binding repeat-containing protein [Clostridium sp. JNZ X4-2]